MGYLIDNYYECKRLSVKLIDFHKKICDNCLILHRNYYEETYFIPETKETRKEISHFARSVKPKKGDTFWRRKDGLYPSNLYCLNCPKKNKVS